MHEKAASKATEREMHKTHKCTKYTYVGKMLPTEATVHAYGKGAKRVRGAVMRRKGGGVVPSTTVLLEAATVHASSSVWVGRNTLPREVTTAAIWAIWARGLKPRSALSNAQYVCSVVCKHFLCCK